MPSPGPSAAKWVSLAPCTGLHGCPQAGMAALRLAQHGTAKERGQHPEETWDPRGVPAPRCSCKSTSVIPPRSFFSRVLAQPSPTLGGPPHLWPIARRPEAQPLSSAPPSSGVKHPSLLFSGKGQAGGCSAYWVRGRPPILVPPQPLSGSPGGTDSQEPAYNVGDPGSIPGSGRSSGEGNGYPLQDSHLENPVDKEAWWDTYSSWGHKDRTRLSN